MSLIKINITVYIAGTSPMLWTHELFLVHALMSAGTFCRHASIVILPPPSSLDRAPYFMADMPDSTPVESVFDWFLSWPGSYDNDHRKKWQKLQGKFVHSTCMWINGKLSWGNQAFRASCLVLGQGFPDLLCQCISVTYPRQKGQKLAQTTWPKMHRPWRIMRARDWATECPGELACRNVPKQTLQMAWYVKSLPFFASGTFCTVRNFYVLRQIFCISSVQRKSFLQRAFRVR